MRDDEAARTIIVEFGADIEHDTVQRVLRAVAAAIAEPPPKGARVSAKLRRV